MFNLAGHKLLNQIILTKLKPLGIQLTTDDIKIYEKAYSTLVMKLPAKERTDFKKSNDLKEHPESDDFVVSVLPGAPYPLIIIKSIPLLVKNINEQGESSTQSQIVPRMAISLKTGECFFLKIHEPKFKDDSDPTRQATSEFNRCRALNLSTHLGLVYSDKGVTAYSLLPFCPGNNVQQLMDKELLTIKHVFFIMRELCAVLQTTWHEKNCLHMDIKPSNIMFDIASIKFNLIDFQSLIREGTVIPARDPDDWEKMICLGTYGYSHPHFLRAIADGLEVKCMVGHDIYPAVITMLKLIQYAKKLEKQTQRKEIWNEANKQLNDQIHMHGLHGFVPKPVEEIATLSTIHTILKKIEQQYDELKDEVSASKVPRMWRDSPMPSKDSEQTPPVQVLQVSASIRKLEQLKLESFFDQPIGNLGREEKGRLSIPGSPRIPSTPHSPVASSPVRLQSGYHSSGPSSPMSNELPITVKMADSCKAATLKEAPLLLFSSPIQSAVEDTREQSPKSIL